jgi:RHS repeat-associated protein
MVMSRPSARWARRLAPALVCALIAGPARAQVAPTASASATTVTLPSGPGSVAGLASPAELDVFSGQVGYSVPIRVPTAGGLSPSIALTYSGALGNGPLGIGWTLGAPAIRRSLKGGVPRYDDRDELTIEGVGGGRLVAVGADRYAVEGAGSTYLVRRAGDGFDVTDGDGTRYRFGRAATGRIEDGRRTAVWLLERVDNLAGETMTFGYRLDRGQRYLSEIAWGPAGRYRVEVVLDGRDDVVTSFATGFEVTTALRVARIRSLVTLPGAQPVELARYDLRYDDQEADAMQLAAVSRLVRVTMSGRRTESGAPVDGATLPPVRFTYAEPARPRQWALDGSGWVVDQRGVALVDVDGDGADDLLRLEPGYAAWRKNLGGTFAAAQPVDGGGHLELAAVRFLDLDGDARAEVVRIVDDEWRAARLEVEAGRARLGEAFAVAGSRGVPLAADGAVLADVDGDGMTDALESVTSGVRLRRGSPRGLGPAIYLPPLSDAAPNVEPGASDVRFLDVNGDGPADAVWLTDRWMKVYLGRGDGTFHAFAKVFYPWGTAAIEVAQIHLVDLDRDGVLDLLRVDAAKLRWFHGRAGFRFATVPRQLARPAGADLDARVSFSDVDGNGSEEVVWSNPDAMWALDLAGGTTRAMLASIDDGMGEVTHFAYGTSTELSLAAAAAGMPWSRLLPRSMAVPTGQRTEYADGTPARAVELGVRDGFWDGEERRFGGFLVGRTVLPGDTGTEVRVDESTFHEGVGRERLLRGKPVEVRVMNGLGALFTHAVSRWEVLPVASQAGAPDPAHPLLGRAVLRSERTSHHDGRTTPIETFVETSYDAEARPFEVRDHGRVDLGSDDSVRRTHYASDEALWVRDRIVEESLHRGDGGLVTRTRQYYGNHQGAPLAHGQIGFGWPRLTEGYLWREGNGATAPRWVTVSSTEYDRHGNVIAQTAGPSGILAPRRFEYDGDGLFPVRETAAPAADRTLAWSATWDPISGVPTAVTDPAGRVTHAEYDGLGRVVALRQNALAAHQHFVYDWTAPRPKTYSYSFDGVERDLAAQANSWQRTDRYVGWRHGVTVADSAGDTLFTAGRLSASTWLVTGWHRKDGRGRVHEVLEGFTHDGAGLPAAPPSGVALRKQTIRYDVLDRPTEQVLPTGARTVTTYRPFEQTIAVDGLAPVTSYFDGGGRIVRTERSIASNAGETSLESVDATYDAGGRVLALELQRPRGAAEAACAPGGAVPWISHCFAYDSFGRLVEADDPDIGLRELGYDDAGQLIRHVNGAGQGITLGYDPLGRLTRRRADDGTQFDYYYDVGTDGRTVTAPGHLTWVREPAGGRAVFRYDQFGRTDLVNRSIGGPSPVQLVHTMQFAPSGVQLYDQYARDWFVRNSYDMAGRLTRVDGGSQNNFRPLWEATEFDGAGRLTGERFGNGVVASYRHDANGQTSGVTIRRGAAGDVLYDIGLTRNSFGAVTDAIDGDGRGLDHTARFGYDTAGRLTSAIFGGPPAQGASDGRYELTYGYDGRQNMVSRQMPRAPRALGQHLGVHCYGEDGAGPRQLTRVVAGTSGSACNDAAAPVVASFSYDAAGRQLTDGDARMSYDGLDQLVAVDLPGGVRVEYGYGYDGLRVRSTDNQGTAPEHWVTADLHEQGGVYEQYVRVGERIVAKVELANVDEGSGAAAVVRGAGRAAGIALLVIAVGLLLAGMASARRARSWRPALASLLVVAITTSGCGTLFGSSSDDALWRLRKATYLHTGFAAGPVLITGDDARIVDERRYEPFGQAIDSFRETGGFFAGIDYGLERINGLNKPTDARTDWSYHGARWMAPQTGRWLTPDPPVKAPDPTFMAQPWRMHPYQYVDQNPIVYWDPKGTEPDTVGSYELAANGGYYSTDTSAGDFVVAVAKGAVKAGFGMARDTGARVVDLTTMSVSATGQATGWWDVGHTEWSPEARNYNPDASVMENVGGNLWDHTVGGVIDLGRGIASGDPDAIGAGIVAVALGKAGRGRGGRGAAGAIPCASFLAGTLVVGEHGPTPIERLAAGAMVVCSTPGEAEQGRWRLCRVEAAWSRSYQGDLVRIEVGGSVVVATADHPYWIVEGDALDDRPAPSHLATGRTDAGRADVRGRWVDAAQLRAGDVLPLADGTFAAVSSAHTYGGIATVYNLSTQETHTYAVGAGTLVHNSPCPVWAPGKQLWNKGKQGSHFRDHGAEVGARSSAEYSRMASEFGSAPNTGQFLDLQSGAYFYRFEPATGKVFVGTTAGQKIKTFYRWDGRPNDVVITSLREAGKL